jgi:hypothetical protein
MAFYGLDSANFRGGLDKWVAEVGKKSPTLEKALFGGLKQSSIFNWIASPIGAATSILGGTLAAIGASMNEQMEKVTEIKKFMGTSQLGSQDAQRVMNAAKGAGVDAGGAAKAILKIAEAQTKVKDGSPGAADDGAFWIIR